jgi:hypothetical protein
MRFRPMPDGQEADARSAQEQPRCPVSNMCAHRSRRRLRRFIARRLSRELGGRWHNSLHAPLSRWMTGTGDWIMLVRAAGAVLALAASGAGTAQRATAQPQASAVCPPSIAAIDDAVSKTLSQGSPGMAVGSAIAAR